MQLSAAGGLLVGAGEVSIINQLLMTAACISASSFYKGQCSLDILKLGRVCSLHSTRDFLSGRNFLCALC